MELTIEITDHCYNRCIHCSSLAGPVRGKWISLTRIDEILDELQPGKVILSGGEPMTYPRIADIISMVKQRGIVIGINTCGVFPIENIPENLHRVDEFYVSFFYIDAIDVMQFVPWNGWQDAKVSSGISFLHYLKVMFPGKKIWLNVVMMDWKQVVDVPSVAYFLGVPVHLMQLVPHGRATLMDRILPFNEQRILANSIVNQLDPSIIDDRIPRFLEIDGYDDITFTTIRDECYSRLAIIHPGCRVSHSLLEEKCRATEKRTLLPDGRLIGCVAGKGIDERFDVIKACMIAVKKEIT